VYRSLYRSVFRSLGGIRAVPSAPAGSPQLPGLNHFSSTRARATTAQLDLLASSEAYLRARANALLTIWRSA
jgi:hypothetical protein